MDYKPTAYLKYSSEIMEVIRKDIDMDKPGELKEAVRILDEWVNQQPYLMEKEFDQHYLEMSIVASKGSIERAKKVIQSMCAARTLKPENFEPRDPKEYYEIFKNNFTVTTTSTLTPENYRIIIIKVFGNIGNDLLESVYKYVFSYLEYVRTHDYHSGVVVIFDVSEVDLPYFMTHVNYLELKNAFVTCLKDMYDFWTILPKITITIESYGLRLKKLHVITPVKAIQVIISFFKPFFSKKIFDRIVVNGKVEDLLQYYSKEVLPKEYGGTEISLLESQDIIMKLISTEEHLGYMKKMSKAKIDEFLFPLEKMYDPENINGTFRSLNID